MHLPASHSFSLSLTLSLSFMSFQQLRSGELCCPFILKSKSVLCYCYNCPIKYREPHFATERITGKKLK